MEECARKVRGGVDEKVQFVCGFAEQLASNLKKSSSQPVQAIRSLETATLDMLLGKHFGSGAASMGVGKPTASWTARKARGSRDSFSSYWSKQDTSIIANQVVDYKEDDPTRDADLDAMPFWLILWGFHMPRTHWRRWAAYRICVILATVLPPIIGWSLGQQREEVEDQTLSALLVLRDSLNKILLLGGFAAIMLLHCFGILCGSAWSSHTSMEMVVSHSIVCAYYKEWKKRSRRHAYQIMFMCLAAWVAYCYVVAETNVRVALKLVSFFTTGGMFSAAILYIIHICTAQALMVDNYFSRFTKAPNLVQLIHEWNVIQAILRRSSQTLAPSLVMLMVTPGVQVLVFGMTIMSSDDISGDGDASVRGMVLTVLPILLIFLALVKAGWCAVNVSGKCERAEVFANSLLAQDLASSTETGRMAQRLIHFISMSKAGFYISDMRLASGTALKLVYLCSITTLTMIVRFIPSRYLVL